MAMEIEKVHFINYVLPPGQSNGRTQTVFARDVDEIELLPNGVRIKKGKTACFFFDKSVASVDYVEAEATQAATPKAKQDKKPVSISFEET